MFSAYAADMALVAMYLVAAQLGLFHVCQLGQGFSGAIAERLLALRCIDALEAHFDLLVGVGCILSRAASGEGVAV